MVNSQKMQKRGARQSLAFLMLSMLLIPTAPASSEDASITVKLRRKPDATKILIDILDLWVNGNKLGSVISGRDVVFKLLPADSGKYTFWTSGNYADAIFASSKRIDISAKPGSTIIANTGFASDGTLTLQLVLVVPPPLRVLSAHLSDRYVEKELSREIIDTPRGATRTIKRTRSFERSVSVGTTTGLDSSLKADLSVIAAEIRSKLELAITQSTRESETIEQTIQVDGNILPRVAIAWIEKRQIGTASASVNGAPIKIPFELVRSLELRVVPLNK